MEFGLSQSVNNLLLGNIVEDISITNSVSTPVINHQNFKENINPVFEKYDESNLIAAFKNSRKKWKLKTSSFLL